MINGGWGGVGGVGVGCGGGGVGGWGGGGSYEDMKLTVSAANGGISLGSRCWGYYSDTSSWVESMTPGR